MLVKLFLTRLDRDSVHKKQNNKFKQREDEDIGWVKWVHSWADKTHSNSNKFSFKNTEMIIAMFRCQKILGI